jgi:hypothetical protein
MTNTEIDEILLPDLALYWKLLLLTAEAVLTGDCDD